MRFFILIQIFSLFSILFSSNFVKIETTPIKFFIEDVDSETVTFNRNNQDLKVGETGIVVKQMKYENNSIISIVTISKIENGLITAELSEFDGLKQESVPHGKWQPAKGDLLVFRLNYDRIMSISDSYENYRKTIKAISDPFLNLIHPDILSATLYSRGDKIPTKKGIQDVCRTHNIGLITISIQDKLFINDCQSFKNLYVFDLDFDEVQTKIEPFYNRLELYKKSFENNSYDKFYLELFDLN